MRVEKYTTVNLGDDVIIWVRNEPYKTYTICNGQIYRANTNEYIEDQVTLYKQIINEYGEKLDEPIYDDDDCYFVYSNGEKIKCSEVGK